MADPTYGYLIIAGMALLLASAGFHKLRGLGRFMELFAAYRLIPESLARRTAWVIPWLELAAAAGLLWTSTRRASVVFAMIVLLAYAAALSVNLLRGRRDLDCGCGAAHERRAIAAWMVWRNLLLAAVLGIALLPWSPRALGLTDFLTFAGGLIVLATLYVAVDRLLGDVAPRTLLLKRTA